MGTSKPRKSDSGIVDLSNDKAWQSRLDEARARRAQVLKEAGHDAPRQTARVMPWEEPDAATDGEDSVDFHDRMNRFKRLSGLGATPERTPEEMAKIDGLLSGRQKTLRFGKSRPRDADATVRKDEDAAVAKTVDALLLTAANEVDSVVAEPKASLRESAATSLEPVTVSLEPRKPKRRRLFGGWFLVVCLCLMAATVIVMSQGNAVTSYFWDRTPPAVQPTVAALPSVILDDLGRGAMAPNVLPDDWNAGFGVAPTLTPPVADTGLENQVPAPKPFASL